MLTAEDKAEILADFEEWSGGFTPNEMSQEASLFFVHDNYEGSQEVLDYLLSI